MKKFLSLFLLLFLITAFGSARNSASAGSDIANLSDYNDGDLNGQDGWSTDWNSLLIQDSLMTDGTKAVRNQPDFEALAYKDIPADFVEAGSLTFAFRVENNSLSPYQGFLGLYNGIGEDSIALFKFANNIDAYDNELVLSVANSADVLDLGPLAQDKWHQVSLAWRASDYKIRVKLDDSAWSDWFGSQTSWGGGNAFGVRLDMPPANSYGNFYLGGLSLSAGDGTVN